MQFSAVCVCVVKKSKVIYRHSLQLKKRRELNCCWGGADASQTKLTKFSLFFSTNGNRVCRKYNSNFEGAFTVPLAPFCYKTFFLFERMLHSFPGHCSLCHFAHWCSHCHKCSFWWSSTAKNWDAFFSYLNTTKHKTNIHNGQKKLYRRHSRIWTCNAL